MPTKHVPLPELSVSVRSDIKVWLEGHQRELPEPIAMGLRFCLDVAEKVTATPHSQGILRQLQRALGIIPSSEKSKKDAPSSPAKERPDRLERLRFDCERASTLGKWHRQCAQRHGRNERNLKQEISRLENLELPELTPEDEAQLEEEHRQYLERLALGQRCDLECSKGTEELMTGITAQVARDEEECLVDRDSLPPGSRVTQEFFESRERIDFSFKVRVIDVAVEKVAIEKRDGSQSLLSASVEEIGPAKMRITWEFLASMAVLMAQYAMPLNRFAKIVSSSAKHFTAGELSRYVRYVAERLVSVYLELARSLADTAILNGDDTPSKVLEVTRFLEALEQGRQRDPPWAKYATQEKAQAAPTSSLAIRLAQTFGFESERKDGSGSKTGFNTSVLSGRLNPCDPRSTIIFYRSHLGGLGNLLDMLLKLRPLENRHLIIQADLATVNLVSDPELLARITVEIAGCASHARRAFWLNRTDDPELCHYILHEFKGITIFERGIDAYGRNRENTLAVRGADILAIWERIKHYATQIASRWSRESPLGQAARYVLRHYDRLTYYLRDHRLTPHNNFSERMLRLERLIENNALFRQTLEGRFALDILRTVLQTAIAARVDLVRYLIWLMRMPSEVVDRSPHEFTPLAYARLPEHLR